MAKKTKKTKASAGLVEEMAGEVKPPKSLETKVGRMCGHAAKLLKVIEGRTEELKEFNAQYRALMDIEIPATMEDAGITKLTLASGHEVAITEEMNAGLTGKYKEPALKWLRKNGHRALITNEVIVDIPKGKDAKTRALIASIKKVGYAARRQETVHTGTFKATVRADIAKGKDVPMSEIGVTTWTTTKIKSPKE